MTLDITKCAKCQKHINDPVHTAEDGHLFQHYKLVVAPSPSRKGMFIFLSVIAAIFLLFTFLL